MTKDQFLHAAGIRGRKPGRYSRCSTTTAFALAATTEVTLGSTSISPQTEEAFWVSSAITRWSGSSRV